MGLLQPLPVAEGRWQRIGIDYITVLPVSGSGHYCIVTFVDHMIKRAHWRACRKTIDAPAFACIFMDDIVRLHGVPQEVVSDRDVRFTADYLKEVDWIVQTKLRMSTGFLPETDGLSGNSDKMVVPLCVASPLTIKPIGMTTSHLRSMLTIPQYTVRRR